MDILTRAELTELAHVGPFPCVSIYAPMHRAGSETRQNPIRAKNLVSEAANRLSQLGCSRDQVERVLRPAVQLGDSPDNEFWRHQAQSLAMLLAPDFARFVRLPYETAELVVVGERFNLKPLLRLLTGDGPFHILALSQQQVRLFQATRYQIELAEVDDLPAWNRPWPWTTFRTRSNFGLTRAWASGRPETRGPCIMATAERPTFRKT